ITSPLAGKRTSASSERTQMRVLTRVEILTISGVTLFAALVFGCRTQIARAQRERGECIMNLRNLGAGYSSFVLDNGHPPTEISTNAGGTKEYVGHPENTYMHFRVIVSSYLRTATTNISASGLVCPLDDRLSATLET